MYIFTLVYFYFSINEMSNVATRTVRTGASPNFVNVVNNNDGLTTERNTPPFSFSKEDKTGAHSIAALDNYICASKNGSIYSDNIKASIGEKPDSVNPYIPMKTHKPLPRESFRPTDGRLANSCGCMLGKKRSGQGNNTESFCGCGKAFMDNAGSIMAYGPIVIVILVLLAAFLVARIIISRKGNRNETTAAKTMAGGAIDESFDSII